MFFRKNDYSDTTINDVRKLIKAGKRIEKEILVIPYENCLICVYGGMTFAQITDEKWICFSGDYEKYFPDDYVFDELKRDYKSFLLNETDNFKNLNDVLSAIWKGEPNDVEKHTQYLIACNNWKYTENTFSICDLECRIPSEFLENGKSPRLDYVILCPENNEMIIVEFKCSYHALYNSNGIREHWTDYSEVKKKINDMGFVHEMVKSYKLICQIYEKSIPNICEEKIYVKVAFLLTGNHYKGVKDRITQRANDSAQNQVLAVSGREDEEKKALLWYWSPNFENVIFEKGNFKPIYPEK